MCIIAAKPAKTNMPSRETLRQMWDRNRDGAGFMYTENGSVRIEKGFMTFKSFSKALNKVENRLDLTKTPMVFHFRITTHGGTSPENTHPFPVTDNVGALKKTLAVCDLGVAHNGIIHSVVPRKGISDTMEYIASQLAPLKRAMPRFYENKHALQLVKNAIESKMAFLTKEGRIITVGDFIEDNGILYSNSSFKEVPFRSLSAYYYGGWDDEWETYNLGYKPGAPFLTGNEREWEGDSLPLMWLPEDAYVVDPDGEMLDPWEYLIDAGFKVYEFDYDAGLAVELPDYRAYTAEGMTLRYDPEQTSTCPVLI